MAVIQHPTILLLSSVPFQSGWHRWQLSLPAAACCLLHCYLLLLLLAAAPDPFFCSLRSRFVNSQSEDGWRNKRFKLVPRISQGSWIIKQARAD